MDDKERDAYLLEILDRLARLETKLDDHVETRRMAESSYDLSKENRQELVDVRRRLDENDNKWETDRREKKTMWMTVLGGSFAILAAILGGMIAIFFN